MTKPTHLFKLMLTAWAICGFAWTSNAQNHAYGEVLQKSMFFYEAQRSGKLPANNRVNWRGDSGLDDGKDKNLDLTGGWYDAGDNLKLNFPMAGAVTALAWGGIEYKDTYEESGQMTYLKSNLKWVTDYFIRCHTAPNELWGHVGSGADHQLWTAAEVATLPIVVPRPSYKIDAARPGSDLAAETAAAMAATSMVFKDSDPTYSATLLAHAKQLYAFADQHRGKYSDAISAADEFYRSYNGYNDELVWGAIWLYRATNDASYLAKAEAEYDNIPNEHLESVRSYKWPHSWDNKAPGSYLLLYKLTGKQKYKTDMERHLAYWTDGYNDNGSLKRIDYTPGGLPHKDRWGSLRYASNAAFTAFLYSDLMTDAAQKTKYYNFARKIINYALGDNPNNFSYVVGYGSNYPARTHHRTAHGWASGFNWIEPKARHIIYGAMVGGPNLSDSWNDNLNAFEFTEVAVDYNALFTGAVARLARDYNKTATLANFPQPEVPSNEFFITVARNSFPWPGTNKIEVTGTVHNWSSWPARFTKKLTFRYFVNLSEAINAGFKHTDFVVTGNEGITASALQPWNTLEHIYYTDATVSSIMYPGGENVNKSNFTLTISLPNSTPSSWDVTNDWSYVPNADKTVSEKLGFYENGVFLGGKIPPVPQVIGGVARFAVSQTVGRVGTAIAFDASSSYHLQNQALTYAWNFGDGSSAVGKTASRVYTTPGTYKAVLTITDAAGIQAKAQMDILVLSATFSVCTFGAPLATPLPEIPNRSYRYIHSVGYTGPNTSNITGANVNWNLQNNGLYQFSFTTSNGSPSWHVDLTRVITHTFGSANPSVTINGSGLPGMDGSYDATLDGVNLVLLAKNRLYALYFSNSATPPAVSCSTAARLGLATEEMVTVFPVPSEHAFTLQSSDNFQSIQHIDLYDLQGRHLERLDVKTARNQVISFGENLKEGFYLIKLTDKTGTGIKTMKILKK